MGIELDVIGRFYGNSVDDPGKVLGNYDLIFAVGRSALEAMACGAAVIVWKTGSCYGLGRGEAPDSYAFAFRRLTDYVSGAFLLTPRSLFEKRGGFDVRFAPAYYEDVDYCLGLWQMGREVIYEPDALVLHLESFSAQPRKTAVELMRVNNEKLKRKHHAWLEKNHLENKAEKIARAS